MTAVNRNKTMLILLCLLLLALGVQGAFGQVRSTINLVGSRYMYFTVTDMATKFMIRNRDTTIRIDDADRHVAWTRLLDGAADGMMNVGQLDEDQLLEAKDAGINLTERVVGFGAVVILVNRDNPLNEITLEDLRKVFSGVYTNWNQLGGMDQPIVVLTRDESLSGTEILLRDLALDGMPISQRALRLSEHDMVRAVKARPGAIGDARYGEAFRRGARGLVKILAIKENQGALAVMPSDASIKNKSYSISGPLVLYCAETSTKGQLMKKFIDFCVSEGTGTALAEKKP